MEIYLKKEHLHYTGSVKERGVLYQLTCLTQVTREKEKDPFTFLFLGVRSEVM